MNKELLRKIVKSRTGSGAVITELIRICGLNKNTASARLSGKIPFRADEIEKIRTEYGLSDEAVVDVFIKETE